MIKQPGKQVLEDGPNLAFLFLQGQDAADLLRVVEVHFGSLSVQDQQLQNQHSDVLNVAILLRLHSCRAVVALAALRCLSADVQNNLLIVQQRLGMFVGTLEQSGYPSRGLELTVQGEGVDLDEPFRRKVDIVQAEPPAVLSANDFAHSPSDGKQADQDVEEVNLSKPQVPLQLAENCHLQSVVVVLGVDVEADLLDAHIQSLISTMVLGWRSTLSMLTMFWCSLSWQYQANFYCSLALVFSSFIPVSRQSMQQRKGFSLCLNILTWPNYWEWRSSQSCRLWRRLVLGLMLVLVLGLGLGSGLRLFPISFIYR